MVEPQDAAFIVVTRVSDKYNAIEKTLFLANQDEVDFEVESFLLTYAETPTLKTTVFVYAVKLLKIEEGLDNVEG